MIVVLLLLLLLGVPAHAAERSVELLSVQDRVFLHFVFDDTTMWAVRVEVTNTSTRPFQVTVRNASGVVTRRTCPPGVSAVALPPFLLTLREVGGIELPLGYAIELGPCDGC